MIAATTQRAGSRDNLPLNGYVIQSEILNPAASSGMGSSASPTPNRFGRDQLMHHAVRATLALALFLAGPALAQVQNGPGVSGFTGRRGHIQPPPSDLPPPPTTKDNCGVGGLPGLRKGDGTGPCTAGVSNVDDLASAGRAKTFQFFGAAGDGVRDDTAAVSAALNSGAPIDCNGSFVVSSLVTVTNKDVFVRGTHRGCAFIYSTPQSMVAITEAPANKVTLRDLNVSIRAAITAVTGAAKTAALLISYTGPGGVHNGPDVSVDLEHLDIHPDAAGHYVANGIYLSDTNVTRVRDTFVGGDAGTLRNTAGIVFASLNSASTAYLEHNFGQMLATGISLPPPANGKGGFQGVRVRDFDCALCAVGVNAVGSADGTSDYLDVSGVEGSFSNTAVVVQNVAHAFVHHNYVFLSNVPGAPVTSGPTCFSYSWTGLLTNKPAFNIGDNTCDGYQVTGYASRIGVNIQGQGNIAMAGIVGSNALSNLDFGAALQAGTAGVLVMPQSTTLVATPYSNAAKAGQNTHVAPAPY